LTRATHKAILTADLILANKLVPSGILDLIPRRTPVHIARKFPGNAERAQEDELGLAGLSWENSVVSKEIRIFMAGREANRSSGIY
jgi:uroporphyrin-III C-methyltransferase